MPTREQIGWLRALIADFESLRAAVDQLAADEDAGYAAFLRDEDPTATLECLRECRALADELERGLPAESPAPPARDTTFSEGDVPW
jgi:hypothetical protein